MMTSGKRAGKRTLLREINIVQITAILGLGILCTSIFIYFNYTESLETFQKNVTSRCEDLAEQLSLPVWNVDKETVKKLMDVSHRSISHILGIVLVGADGVISYSTLKGSHTETLEKTATIKIRGKGELGTLTMVYGTRSLRMENYKTMLILGSTIVGVIIIICFVNFFILKYRIGESLVQMMSGIRRIIDGDYDRPLPAFRLYEFNRFGEALNQSARRISERENEARKLNRDLENLNKELEKANRELENRVKKRTGELEKANEHLGRMNEDLKRAKEAAVAATRAKSEFLANMSHEIRTPMNGVIGAADLLMGLGLSPDEKKYAGIILNSGNSLLGIIDDILDFSRIEAGKLNIEERPFFLPDALDRVTEMFAPKTGDKGIELILDLDLDAPKALVGDNLRLQQMLTNLVGNAVKFTPRGGIICIGFRAREIRPERAILEFFVKDTGIGMEKEFRDRLFEPFSQADASTTRKFGGSGLGLCITKQLAELMGGKIWVRSEPGEGSAFFFTVPFGRRKEEKEKPLGFPRRIKDLHVLVVDDSNDSRRILKNILESWGFGVAAAASGLEALRMARDRGPGCFDLVFMDWAMPGMDGIEAARELRETCNDALPIIMLTAFGNEDVKQKARSIGINAFLNKPVHQSTIFDTIMNILGETVDDKKPPPIITRADIYKKRLKGVKVLLAEDNPTNQEIAAAILTMANISVEIVDNGGDAVDAVAKGAFDAVLMDIQMPGMDGCEATRRIRENPEHETLPIIAMTAHAMKGDEEMCLSAGMNGYVGKPVNQDTLFKVLWKSIEPGKRSTVEEREEAPREMEETGGKPSPPCSRPGLHIHSALETLRIPHETYRAILFGFLGNNRDTAEKMHEALERRDFAALKRQAHTLKGSSANIGAYELQEIAERIEFAIHEESQDPRTTELIQRAGEALEQVMDSIESLGPPEAADPAGSEPIGHDELGRMLADLNESLVNLDPDSRTLLDRIKPHLEDPLLDELETNVYTFDFQDALKILEQIVENPGRRVDE